MTLARTYRAYATSSELYRLAKCAPSATLEAIGHETAPANEGNAGHEHYEEIATLGVDAAVERLPIVARKWFGNDERETAFFIARMRKLQWLPPKGAFGEVALCMLEDGSVQRTKGGKGHYPELPDGAILAGQTDVIWSEPEPLDLSDPAHPKCPPGSVLWVGDYKFGDDAYVEPVETNLQAAANATMMARWTGAKRVVPFVLYMRPPEGDWDVPMRDGEAISWGARELADAEKRVRAVIERRRQAVAKAIAGEPIDGFTEGLWCGFCPGRYSCPARVGTMREVAALAVVPRKRGEGIVLSSDELAWWAVRLPMIEGLAARAREVLRDNVDLNGPIDLGNGLVWGKKPTVKSKLVPSKALPILREEFGDERLDELLSISKSAIEETVKQVHEEAGIKRQKSKAMGRILGAIKDAGGVKEEKGETYGPHKPVAELEGEVVEADEEHAAQ